THSTPKIYTLSLHDALPIYKYSDLAYKEEHDEMTKTADRRIAPSAFERMPKLFKIIKPEDGKEYIRIYGNLKNERVFRWLRKDRSEEHTSELQSRFDLVCRL